ncbi:MAG: alanine racemase [Candidatus Dactylopiibacterium carminicum]|uniref:Alanine racemase n=1 Tax=Candidatus Dactylopiibacterium carminicum TaxID=857335 RepID=A0A272EV30_9RHOO|nr:alanine racemase [Candidatus Dactylopiibacterium carminicum]KAF7599843.1 alanine racemase [Candidatus Dactylopiibacterium carminicum]PAS93954.1 MAG: alanine racemase [Candidatus Dactylopiibacterium carminicum]PAS97269.1 MAG: alanine racemase [Candidatus Dactylopiibacterium carminicum]PAS99843.1 MAG: alanine racemase [Candidatus Dactylopiibacterium carminicum]
MSRPIFARIDPQAFRHNYLLCKQRAAGAKTLAIVKANAYGHGLLCCAEAVRDVADGFGLLEIGEALQLRNAGFTQPIVMLEGFFAEADLLMASEARIQVALHSDAQLGLLEMTELPAPLDVFIKLNTGMQRLGFPPERFAEVLARVRACGRVGEIGVMTHFACADAAGITPQLACFDAAVAGSGLPRSVANSAALLRNPEARYEWVRPGIVLYGGSPMPDLQSAEQIGLRPVMSFFSRIISVQDLQPGDAVGYGGLFVADKPMRIATVACGYADGYPRHAGTGTPILVNGQRTRTIGRVSMDMLCCDITGLEAGVGSLVTLWGEGLPADEVATAAGTVSYELFCALAQRVPVTSC